MKQDSQNFRRMLEEFERHCSGKLIGKATADFINLLEWFVRYTGTAYDTQLWRCFVEYCRCQIMSNFAAFLLQDFPKDQSKKSTTTVAKEEKVLLACYCYSLVLQLAPDLNPAIGTLWWVAGLIFCKLEAHNMLTLLLRKRERKEALFWLLVKNDASTLITKCTETFPASKASLSLGLCHVFGEVPCQGKVCLEPDIYDSAIRNLMTYDTSAVALKRLVWLWHFGPVSWTECIMRNEYESIFEKIPSAPRDFDNTTFENLSALDIMVFARLSVLVAATKQKIQLPLMLCEGIKVSKDQEKFWASVKAHEFELEEPQDSMVEDIEKFLRYIRLTQQPLPCRTLLEAAARVVYIQMQEKPTAPTREAILWIGKYGNAYRSALEAAAKGEEHTEEESSYFIFADEPSAAEPHRSPSDAEHVIRNSASPAATGLQGFCKRPVDSTVFGQLSMEGQSRQTHYPKRNESISERPLAPTDDPDKVDIVVAGEGAEKQERNFLRNAPLKWTVSQSNLTGTTEHRIGGSECKCHETFSKVFESFQQIIDKFGGLLESIFNAFTASIKIVAEQNKQMVPLPGELLKSVAAPTPNEAQARAFDQYRKTLLDCLPTNQISEAEQTASLNQPAQNDTSFSSSLASVQMHQLPWVALATAHTNTMSSTTATPVPSIFAQANSLAGWQNTFNLGTSIQPPQATQTSGTIALAAEQVAHTGEGLFPSPAPSIGGLPTEPPAESQAPRGTSITTSEGLGYASKTNFDDVPVATKIALDTPVIMSTALQSEGLRRDGPTAGKVPTAATPKEFRALAKPKTATLTFTGKAAAAGTTSSRFGKSNAANPELDFGSLVTFTSQGKEAVSSGPRKSGLRSMKEEIATMKSNGCIPPAQFKSLVEEQKDVKPVPASSSGQEPTSPPVGDNKQAGESEESEHEDDVRYEPAAPLAGFVEVVTGEENEEVIFKERAKMFRYHKETKEYKECGVGDLKILKHPVANKYRMVMRRDLVHKVCANQLLYGDMVLKPLAKRENSYCWIGQDYSGDVLTTALFAVRFDNDEAAFKFKEVIENCAAELKRRSEATDSQEGVESPSVQAGAASEQDEIPSSEESCPTAAIASISDGKGKPVPQPVPSSFGKGAESSSFSFGKSAFLEQSGSRE